MLHYSGNIYKTAREAKGVTQEKAAEMLGVSDSSIRAYETGQRVPPVELVDLMVIAYDSQLLGIQHLRASADLARSIIPDVQELRLPEAIMALLDQIYAFVDNHRDRDLLRIGRDGVVDADERPVFDAIMQRELGGIVEAALALRCSRLE